MILVGGCRASAGVMALFDQPVENGVLPHLPASQNFTSPFPLDPKVYDQVVALVSQRVPTERRRLRFREREGCSGLDHARNS